MKKRNFISAAAMILVLAVFIYVNRAGRPTLKWARGLKASEIVKVESVVMPSAENRRYKLFEEEEFADIAALVNDSHGRYVSNPESLAGGGCTLYITLKDQTVHRVGNNGNTYLQIDGDSFLAGYRWLSSWEGMYGLGTGNSKIPMDFVHEY